LPKGFGHQEDDEPDDHGVQRGEERFARPGCPVRDHRTGTFDPADLHKLLPFTTDADVVFGSRTVQTFIWAGANMGLFLRWGNWFVAKLIEASFGTNYLSDVGCTFRVMRRDVVEDMLPRFRMTGSAFGLELLLRSVALRHPFVQVPVRYRARVGVSSVTGDRRTPSCWAWR